jgi:ABC-2 type transport system ATP-binding protein
MEEHTGKAVVLRSVSKSFGEIRAVRDLDLEIGSGSVYGLLGPNGSGKSTVMRMIIGLVRPDSGSISVCGVDTGRDPMAVKRLVGYVPEEPRMYEYLTGFEYLDFIGDVYGLEREAKEARIEELLAAFGLEGREHDMISGYSHGMKQKTAIIGAILHRPRLLVFDEPLSGLDPKSARIVKDLVHRLAGEGVTTVFSTHVMEIADAVCDRVCVLYGGEKVAEGAPGELRELAEMPDSTLEEVFLTLTKAEDVRQIVEALAG